MSFSKQATKGHLIAGIILVLLSVGSLIGGFTLCGAIFSILVLFFGVWGSMELGRYLEHILSRD
jgi:hypothetical protein